MAATTAIVLLGLAASPAGAQSTSRPAPDDCQAGPVRLPGAVCDVGGAIVDAAPGVSEAREVAGAAADVAGAGLNAATGTVAGGVMDHLTNWVADGAGWMVKELGGAIRNTTTPNLMAPWHREHYGRMVQLAVPFLAVFFLLAVARGVWLGSARELGKGVAAIPLAVLGTAVAVPLVHLAVGAVDGMGSFIAANMDRDLHRFVEGTIGSLGGPETAGVAAFFTFLGALIIAVAGLAIWIQLWLFSAATYIAVGFLPLLFAAAIWHPAVRFAKGLAELLIALIFAKFVIIAVIALAAAGMGAGQAQGFAGLMAAAAALVVAARAPTKLLALAGGAGAAAAAPSRGDMRQYSQVKAMTGQAAVNKLMSNRSGGSYIRSQGSGAAASTGSTALASAGVAAGGLALAAKARPSADKVAAQVPTGAIRSGPEGLARTAVLDPEPVRAAHSGRASTHPPRPPSAPPPPTRGTAPKPAPKTPPRGPNHGQ